jgi:hypothetical protein
LKCCEVDPQKRISFEDILIHPFFKNCKCEDRKERKECKYSPIYVYDLYPDTKKVKEGMECLLDEIEAFGKTNITIPYNVVESIANCFILASIKFPEEDMRRLVSCCLYVICCIMGHFYADFFSTIKDKKDRYEHIKCVHKIISLRENILVSNLPPNKRINNENLFRIKTKYFPDTVYNV